MSEKYGSLKVFVFRRILEAIPLMLGVIILIFLMIHLAPGDPIRYLVGEYEVSREYVEAIRHDLGLDRPLHEQLILYIGSIMRGDLGYSFVKRQPVFDLIVQRIPNTLLLMGTIYLISAIAGISLGVYSAKKPYSLQDNFLTVSSLILFAVPTFWLAQVLMLLFSIQLDLFPVAGIMSLGKDLSGVDHVLDVLHHLILPSLAGAGTSLALIARLTRSGMLEKLREDYIITARSKGLDESTVFRRHALKNAILPIVTVMGMNFGFMLTGAALTETVFSWPGLGRLLYESLYYRDYPVLMGMLLIVSIMVIAMNLFTDVLYAFIDPRIRYG